MTGINTDALCTLFDRVLSVYFESGGCVFWSGEGTQEFDERFDTDKAFVKLVEDVEKLYECHIETDHEVDAFMVALKILDGRMDAKSVFESHV